MIWPIVEVIVALAMVAAGLLGFIPFTSTPWLLLAAMLFVWWRGPGWRAVGLRWPAHPARTLAIGLAVGVIYQFLGLYVIEPLLARLSSGQLPDVSMFRPLWATRFASLSGSCWSGPLQLSWRSWSFAVGS